MAMQGDYLGDLDGEAEIFREKLQQLDHTDLRAQLLIINITDNKNISYNPLKGTAS